MKDAVPSASSTGALSALKVADKTLSSRERNTSDPKTSPESRNIDDPELRFTL